MLFALFTLYAYLASGAIFKIWIVLHYPSSQPMAGALRAAIRPYSIVPVAYALGPRFARLSRALQEDASSDAAEAVLRRAGDDLQVLAADRGAWSDVAAFEKIALDLRQDQTDRSCLVMLIDPARWGRMSSPRSRLTEDCKQRYRRAAEDFSGSPVAADALSAVAELESADWDFKSADVCRAVAGILAPSRFRTSSAESGSAVELARAYAAYLKLGTSERARVRSKLASLAARAGDDELSASLGAGFAPPRRRAELPDNRQSAGTISVRVDDRASGSPIRVALLRLDRLTAAARIGQERLRAPGLQGAPAGGDLFQTMDAINPLRQDDPLRAAGFAMISPALGSLFARELPSATARPGRPARFPAGPPVLGIAALINQGSGDQELSPVPMNEESDSLAVRFAPRVEPLHTLFASSAPPRLRWKRYPGAASYDLALLLQARAKQVSTVFAPEWDGRLVWWVTGVTGTSYGLTPEGFVGPRANLRGNGLWQAWTYRVIIYARGSSGEVLATSIGLQDHAEEFWRPNADWLGLRGEGARVPTASDLFGMEITQRLRLPRRRRAPRPRAEPPDLLEQVLDQARASAPVGSLGGSVEPELRTTLPGTPTAVSLAPWPSSRRDGKGPPTPGAIPVMNWFSVFGK